MKKKRLILLLIITGLCSMVTYLSYRYYTPPSYRQPYLMNKHKTDTLQIAYIGDSWAYMHKNHMCRIAQILEDTLTKPVMVHSYGICGATSKEIYEYMFNNSDFKNFLQKRDYTYCVISSGINDTYKKMSTLYYKKSMDCIIRFFLKNNVRPIILEIPDYNIKKAYENQTKDRKILRRLSMLINGTSLDCKQDFRNALNELIRKSGYQQKVNILKYKTWNKNYPKDLHELYYSDQMHLNENGYILLDNAIANSIINYQSLN